MKPAAVLLVLALAGCAGDGKYGTPPPAEKGSPAAGDQSAPSTPADPAPRDASDVPPAPAQFEIRYSGGSPQAAMIVVRKKVSGRWVERKYVVLPKDDEKTRTGEIGKVEKERDPVTGDFVDADYRTGFVLLDIHKETVGDANGARQRYVIRYRDGAGAEHNLPMDDTRKSD